MVGAKVGKELTEAETNPADGAFCGVALARPRSEGYQPLRATGQGNASRVAKLVTRALRTVPPMAEGRDHDEDIALLIVVENRPFATEGKRGAAGVL